MEAWYYDDPTRFNQEERLIERETKNMDLARMWSLYRYLEKYPPTSATDLRSRTFLDKEGTPVFDAKTAEEVFAIWKSLRDPTQHGKQVVAYAEKRLAQAGGNPNGHVNEEFLDRVFIKLFQLLRAPIVGILTGVGLDPMQDTTLGYASRIVYNISGILESLIFFLYTLESNPNLGGPIWTLLLDIPTKNLPRIVAALEGPILALNTALVAAGGVGVATEAITAIVTAVVALSVASMNLSRRKFGSAFALALLAIPIVGPVFTNSINVLDQMYTDFRGKQDKLSQVPLVGPLLSFDPLAGGFRKTHRNKVNGRRKTARKSPYVDSSRR